MAAFFDEIERLCDPTIPISTRPGSRSRDGIGHWLGATSLIPRVGDIRVEPLQQLRSHDADLGRECVDEAGNEKSNAHGVLLSSGLMLGKSCP